MDLFDKMKDGITKGIDTIGAKGKELVEETQAQLQISSLRGKRRQSLEELGAVALALLQKGALADEAARKIGETIASLDQQIAAKQAELKHDSASPVPAVGTAIVKCDCGAELAAGVKFCSVCGKKAG